MTCFTSTKSSIPWLGLAFAVALVTGLPACTSTSTYEPDDPANPAAYEGMEDALGDEPPSVKTLHSAARVCAARGQDSQAEMAYAEMIKRYPTYMPGYSELAELYLRNEMVESAVMVLQQGLEVQPDDAVLHNNLGMCHLFLREHEAALEQFIQSAALAPEDARSRANMAVSLAMLGRMDEAYANYQL
ncbi:MAG TPA: tetratricopeptide repeat protein, partial [Planctomycetota bacterium]|nr:tetratricopeptide repeat protein [Planctomycetota bacterium]